MTEFNDEQTVKELRQSAAILNQLKALNDDLGKIADRVVVAMAALDKLRDMVDELASEVCERWADQNQGLRRE